MYALKMSPARNKAFNSLANRSDAEDRDEIKEFGRKHFAQLAAEQGAADKLKTKQLPKWGR